MNLLLQLRKICNHVFLMPGGVPEPYYINEDVVGGSGKLLMLDRMLPRLKANGHRVLLFSQFTSMLDILEDYCELRGYSYVRLDGETNRVKRRLDVRRFNAPKTSLFIFLISTRAGGLGLNLASADTVILYDSDWNPQVDLQAMERAHRIGQRKPVRVYRLVCRGSVEERIVLRAEKKLFLNAMVAETDPDEMMNEHVDGSTSDGIAEALGIGGGTAMSKAELASLIRFGANAVFESVSQGVQVSDAELHTMLELDGRDKVPVSSTASSSSMSASSSSSESASAVEGQPGSDSQGETTFADNSFVERLEKLQEVDLRQLGNTVFAKKTKKVKVASVDESNIIQTNDFEPAKRNRKERIVMVDGKGTGYGGAVPMLAEHMDQPANEVPVHSSVSTKSRQWDHFQFCGFCGKSKGCDTFARCAHCPRAFHPPCMEQFGLQRGTGGMFICPHHKCVFCYRSTAAAGGMLFRCTGCLTAYCEDCLPQDEIESVGRSRELEYLGYDSKQSYYIKCPACCTAENVKAQGIIGVIEDLVEVVEEPQQVEPVAATKSSGSKKPSSKSLTKELAAAAAIDEYTISESSDVNDMGAEAGGDMAEGDVSGELNADGATTDAGSEGANTGDAVDPSERAESVGQPAAEEEPEPVEEPPQLLPSQMMRMIWVEYPDSEEERQKKKRQKELEREEARRKAAEARALSKQRKADAQAAADAADKRRSNRLTETTTTTPVSAKKTPSKADPKSSSKSSKSPHSAGSPAKSANRSSSRFKKNEASEEDEVEDEDESEEEEEEVAVVTPKKSSKRSAKKQSVETDDEEEDADTEAETSTRKRARHTSSEKKGKSTKKAAVSYDEEDEDEEVVAPSSSSKSSSKKRKSSAAMASPPASPKKSPSKLQDKNGSSSKKSSPAAANGKRGKVTAEAASPNSKKKQSKKPVESESESESEAESEANGEPMDMTEAALTLLTHPITESNGELMQALMLIQSKVDTGK
jgi:hypothetical protein